MSEEVKISEENQFSFENPEYRKIYWHTCSHVLAQAVKRLWPEVKLAIGPSIDNGFYYDMLAPFSFTPENLAEIEAEMRKICKEKPPAKQAGRDRPLQRTQAARNAQAGWNRGVFRCFTPDRHRGWSFFAPSKNNGGKYNVRRSQDQRRKPVHV